MTNSKKFSIAPAIFVLSVVVFMPSPSDAYYDIWKKKGGSYCILLNTKIEKHRKLIAAYKKNKKSYRVGGTFKNRKEAVYYATKSGHCKKVAPYS